MSAEAISIRNPVAVSRSPAFAVTRFVARRAIVGALIWGAVFSLTIWMIALNFAKEYPTRAALDVLVKTEGSNVALNALFGPGAHIDTVGGYIAYHAIGVLGMIGAIWGLLLGTRLLRGEEDAGRWELLLAGVTTRWRTTASALLGLGVAWVGLWAVTAAATLTAGRSSYAHFSVGDSLFAATATVAAAAMFLAVGALCSQLAASRGQAVGLASAVFGAAYFLRMIAYSSTTLRWLHWVTPLGWVDELRPLTGGNPLMLLPIAGAVAAMATATIVLAGRRDLGAGTLRISDTRAARTRWLNGPIGLAYRVGRGTALAWIGGLGLGGFLVGLLVNGTTEMWASQSSGVIVRLGGATKGAAYLGLVFLMFTFLVAMAAAGQVGATREDEAEGYLDNLLGRPVAHLAWLGGRFAVSAVTLLAIGAAVGLFTWIGAAIGGAGLSFSTVLFAGLNLVPVGIFVLGTGTLAHGIAPRFAGTFAYAVVAWSFLVEIVGASIGAGSWLLDLSVLHHVARAPAAPIEWDHDIVLVAIGVATAIVGALAFARRDLKGA